MTGEIQFTGGCKRCEPLVWVNSLGKILRIPRIDVEMKRPQLNLSNLNTQCFFEHVICYLARARTMDGQSHNRFVRAIRFHIPLDWSET